MGNYERFSFKAEMTNRTTGAQYELDSLSSGERVLMALCLASFNQYLGRRRPKLLLLDELDAVLHPSMVAALVRTLKTLFVPQGTKVLMTSHSAMTVAALDEADIFRVVRTGSNVKVSPATKSEAINELSEGLATVDVGLRIAAYDEAKVTILTEGKNTKHLKRWVELNFPEDVHVFEGLERYTSDHELFLYGQLLGMVNTNTHFVVVWDCDAADKADALRREMPTGAKVTPYVFAKRPDNTVTSQSEASRTMYDECVILLIPTRPRRCAVTGPPRDRPLEELRCKTEFANQVDRCDVSTANGPFVVLLSQDGANEAAHGRPVREDAHHIGASPDLLVETLLWVVGPDLLPVGEWEAGEGQDVGSGLVQ